MDWFQWHQGYQDPSLGQRLEVVQQQLAIAVGEAPPGPIRIASVCAGQGHDVVGVLGSDPRRTEVEALLVEQDPRNVMAARQRIAAAGLSGVEVREGDAGLSDAYVAISPVQVLLLCGVFGSLTDADIDRTIAAMPQLCAPGAMIIWTANRSAQGLFDQVDRSFGRRGCVALWHSDPSASYGVGRHRFVGDPEPIRPGRRLFRFADEATLRQAGRIPPLQDDG